jgi:hypothetical protein
MLQGAGDSWSSELVDLVRQQVEDDQRETSLIAESRRTLFEEDHRPDLEVPLTTEIEPHVKSTEAGTQTTEQPEGTA